MEIQFNLDLTYQSTSIYESNIYYYVKAVLK